MTENTDPIRERALYKQLEKEISELSLKIKELEDLVKSGKDKIEYYRKSFSQSPYPCFLMESVYGVPTRFIEVNASACDLLGTSHDDIVQLDPLDVFSKGQKKAFFKYAETLLDSGKVSLEAKVDTKNSHVDTLQLKFVVLSHGQNPDILAFVMPTISTVFERYGHDTSLLNHASLEFVYKLDVSPQIKFHYISNSFETMTGFSVQELKSKPQVFFESIHPTDREEFLSIIRQCDTVLKPWVGRFLRRDEKVIWLESYVHPVLDAKGKVTGITGVVRDVTVRMQRERRIQKKLNSERIINATYERLIELKTLDNLKDKLLIDISVFLGSDRTLLLLKDSDQANITYCRQKRIINVSNVVDSEIKRLLSGVDLSEEVYYIKNSEELPDVYYGLKEYINKNKIRSMLGVTIRKNGDVQGMLAIEMVSRNIEWDRVDIYLMETMARIVGLSI